MTFVALLGAEWTKVWRRPALRAVAALAAVLGVLYVIFLLLRLSGTAERERLREALELGAILQHASRIVRDLGPVLTVLIAATVFGAEYAFDTWKVLLPRRRRRSGFVISKAVITSAAAAVVAVILLAGFVVPSVPLALWFGAPEVPALADLGQILIELACFGMAIGVYSAIAGSTAMLTRSSIGGIIVGMLFVILLNPIAGRDPLLARVLPAIHLENIVALVTANVDRLDAAQMSFEEEVPLWASLLVVLLYATVPLGAALAHFERRDLAAGGRG